MIPKLASAETLKVLSGLVGGTKALHTLTTESGMTLNYASLSKYINNGASFDEQAILNLFETIRKGNTFVARNALQSMEDAYTVLTELGRMGFVSLRGIGDEGDLKGDWEKNHPLSNDEIKDMEEEFGRKLSWEQKEILKNKRRLKPKPKSSRSIDDLFDDDEKEEKEEEDEIVLARNSKGEVLTNPTEEETKELLKEETKEPTKKNFLEDFLNEGSKEPPPVHRGLTDPFEAGLRQTPDVFTSEDHRF